MVYFTDDEQTTKITLANFNSETLCQTQRAIIDLVKNFNGEASSDTVYFALNLLTELLPEPEQIERYLSLDPDEKDILIMPDHINPGQRLLLHQALNGIEPTNKMKYNPFTEALKKSENNPFLFEPQNNPEQ